MLIEKVNSQYPICRIPGLIITNMGTLIAYYECRSSLSDWAEIDIKIIRSEDKGKTWETVTIIKGNGETLNNPVMFVQDDKIHLLFCKNYAGLYYSISENDGKTFSEFQNISHFLEDIGFDYTVNAIGPGHGISHNGNLIVPIWFAYNKEEPEKHQPSFLRTLYSLDNGKSWNIGEEIGKGVLVNPSEAAMAVCENDMVLISIRNENAEKSRAFAISKTGFSNWEELNLNKNMADPICQGSMFNTESEIYHINCNHSEERKNLTIKISQDRFKTFREITVNELGGYSDIAAKGSEIFVIYEKDIFNPTEAEIRFETFKK